MAELRVLETSQSSAQADVVRVLEHWLERARSGELASVAICGVLSDRITTSSQYSASTSFPALVGASAILTAELARTASDGSEVASDG
jgi:hypothetical protein